MESYKDKLTLLRMTLGKNVLCTNGLFHVIDNNHNEIYINGNNGEIDKRGKYNTLVVMDNIIVARVVNDVKLKFVILKKGNLELLYKTTGEIKYIDDRLIYDTRGVLISHTGKELLSIDKLKEITKIYNNYYLVKTKELFGDKVIMYISKSDRIKDLTKGKGYFISQDNVNPEIIGIIDKNGGNHLYNFTNHQCTNRFTEEREEDIQLWTLN